MDDDSNPVGFLICRTDDNNDDEDDKDINKTIILQGGLW